MILSVPIRVALVLSAGLGASHEVVEGVAAYASSRPELWGLASTLTPANANLLCELGLKLLDTDPPRAAQMLEKAISLNPYDANALVGLGLLAESKSRFGEAEAYLKQAGAVSRRFKPAWALAYYYARRGRTDLFWPAASAAVNINGADCDLLFHLTEMVKDTSPSRGRLKLENQDALVRYVRFLLTQDSIESLGELGLRLESTAANRHLLMAVIDRLIGEGRAGYAVQIWNRLHVTQPHRRLDPVHGVSLNNPLFEASDRKGFEWRLEDAYGIEWMTSSPGNLRVVFSGNQPESTAILERYIPVVPARDYRFEYSYSTPNGKDPGGIAWDVEQTAGPAARSGPLRASGSFSDVFKFHTGPKTEIVKITLRYARPRGSTRIVGTVALHSAKLDLL